MYVVEEKLQDEDQCHIAGDDIGGIQCILFIGNSSVLCLIEMQTMLKLRMFFFAQLPLCEFTPQFDFGYYLKWCY